MVELLAVSSDLADLRIEGPLRHLTTGAPSAKTTVSVGAGNALRAVEAATPIGSAVEAPFLYEDTDYQLSARSNRGGVVAVTTRRARLLEGLSSAFGDTRVTRGTVNFGRQIGRIELRVLVDGTEALSVSLEILPSKMDLLNDFQAILEDLQQISRGLCLDYLAAADRRAGLFEYVAADDLEWLVLLRAHFPAIVKALAYVAEHPYRSLIRAAHVMRSEKIRRRGAAALREIRRLGVRWEGDTPVLPPRLPAVVASETLDNAENRWLKLRLVLVARRLSRIIDDLRALERNYERRGRSASRICEELSQIEAVRRDVERELARPLFEEVGERVYAAVRSSLVLQSRAGYRELHALFHVLESGVDVRGFDETVSISDIATLYEMWCFVAVVKIFSEVAQGPVDLSQLIKVDSNGTRVRLRKGRTTSAVCNVAGRKITVSYNRSFRGLTGDQYPDIVIELKDDGLPELFIILDAKYRLDESTEYVERYGAVGPPIDAVNALHRYRDAITIGFREASGRPTVRGLAVFPSSDTAGWSGETGTVPRLRRALDTMGIGALPFLPRAKSVMRAWLSSVAAESIGRLSYPGPPFMVWETLSTGQASANLQGDAAER
jgi:hypothetical protein